MNEKLVVDANWQEAYEKTLVKFDNLMNELGTHPDYEDMDGFEMEELKSHITMFTTCAFCEVAGFSDYNCSRCVLPKLLDATCVRSNSSYGRLFRVIREGIIRDRVYIRHLLTRSKDELIALWAKKTTQNIPEKSKQKEDTEMTDTKMSDTEIQAKIDFYNTLLELPDYLLLVEEDEVIVDPIEFQPGDGDDEDEEDCILINGNEYKSSVLRQGGILVYKRVTE